MNILITGATGFVGSHLAKSLAANGHLVTAATRTAANVAGAARTIAIGTIDGQTDWSPALDSIDGIVHCAAIAHTSGVDDSAYRAVNTDGTLQLAKAAQNAGCRRFVFLSSVRAQSGPAAPGTLSEADEPRPTDAYGRSKLAAEQGLARLDLDWVALRPVLVYGPGVKGNMGTLIRLARTPLPLPLGGLTAPRSLLAIDNLAAAVDTALTVTNVRRPYLVADTEPVTIPEIIEALRAGMGRAPRLLNLPQEWLETALKAMGRGDVMERLAGRLVVDPSALLNAGWRPVVETRAALMQLAAQPPRAG